MTVPLGGVTLVDYFAAAALPALIALRYPDTPDRIIAKEAYYMAEAMLEERYLREDKEDADTE